MMFDSLPVIIVTAKTKTAAEEMITEMIDDDATAETRPPGHESADRVWRLVNKYYTALVRVRARAEGEPPAPADAHVALLARDELACAAAERRLPAVAAAVNVLACDAPAVPAGLLALCARRRLEPCALREPAAPPAPGPFPEPRGVAALRAALHAHAWPGLRRAPAAAAEAAPQEERFARALEALGGAAARGARLAGAERRAAAERLVAAFAAAIGQPLGDSGLGLGLELDLDPELDLDLHLEP